MELNLIYPLSAHRKYSKNVGKIPRFGLLPNHDYDMNATIPSRIYEATDTKYQSQPTPVPLSYCFSQTSNLHQSSPMIPTSLVELSPWLWNDKVYPWLNNTCFALESLFFLLSTCYYLKFILELNFPRNRYGRVWVAFLLDGEQNFRLKWIKSS